jgi:hypothetical protein
MGALRWCFFKVSRRRAELGAGAWGIGSAVVRRMLYRRARPLSRRQVQSDDERRVQGAHGVDLVRCAAKRGHIAAQQTERLHRVGKQRLARVRRERAVLGADRPNSLIHERRLGLVTTHFCVQLT